MANAQAVAEARRALGRVGAFVGMSSSAAPIAAQSAAIRRLERAAYRAVWTNEVIGTDALVRASLWLAGTERLVVGTCIANMWARPAPTADAAAMALSQAYPGRFVLGLGVGRPEQAASVGRDFGSPVDTARAYLQQAQDPPYLRILGANGPRMLRLAGEHADGALPAGTPPAHTAQARAALGADKLLVVYLPVQQSGDAGGVADSVGEHLDAGADHVVVGMSHDTGFDVAIDRLEQLAPTLAAG